ncbi:MAG: ABC-2 transporter permease [Herbinix sp.]|nr:ABC-2 transporter permease [Herbinix sp.]
MKGLITKDFINISKSFWVIGVLVIFYGAISFVSDSPSSFSGLFTLIIAMYMLSTYSLDEMAKWDIYALTMPLTRDKLVQGKYLMMLILSFMGFLLNMVVLLTLNILTKSESLFDGIEIAVVGAVLVIVFYSIVIPFITNLGIVKARLYFIIIYMVPFMAGSFISKRIKASNTNPPDGLITFIEVVIKNAYIIVPLIMIAALGISYFISIRIYRKKEF